MSAPGDGDTVTRARTALLDALDALGPLRDAVILIGAQAIYLHTGDAPVAIAAYTVDADIQLDTRKLAGEPLIENAMRDAGFSLNATSNQPGAWVSEGGIPVDLMVAASQAGGGNRRARIPPHDTHAARRAAGLEGGLVDNAPMQITALNPDADPRIFTVLVAGPGALLVAKAHKLWERRSTPHRLYDKDAHDVYRILQACRTEDHSEALLRILADPVAAGSCEDALTYIGDLFAQGPDAVGAMMAGRAETGVGNPAVVAASAAILAQDLLADIARRRTPRPPEATTRATD